MNQQRSIYRSDFCPPSWFENNCSSDVEEFCSPDNIDDCLKYISQEFSALGYPSIYTIHSACPYSVNCDIVKLLNVIFEFLNDFKNQVENKEELDSRNQRLSSDIHALSKKNAHLKEHLEQAERKLNSSLERERQLKVKNEQLQSLLKNEKDESKKLSAQIQQQKVAYQREIRKNENNLTQMKNKLNQVLVDKNPDKKIANISTSHLLQRSSNQRGKWKTGSLAKSSTDDMYKSVISSYENRCQIALKEIEEHRQCFQFIEQQLEAILSFVEDKSYQKVLPCLSAILNGNNIQEELTQKFSAMFMQVQDIITNKANDNKNLSKEVKALKSEILRLKHLESITKSSQEKNSEKSSEDHSLEVSTSLNDGESEEIQNISEQKKELVSTLAQIKEEKSKLEAQKLVLIKSAIKQNSSSSPQCSISVPSFCILTTKNGITSVPAAHQLKHCLSNPDSSVKSISPLWKSDLLSPTQTSPSSTNSVFEDSISSPFLSFTSPKSQGNDSVNDDLPNWARAAVNISNSGESLLYSAEVTGADPLKTDSIYVEDITMPVIPSSEEENLAKLRAAAKDIENRRQNFLSKGK